MDECYPLGCSVVLGTMDFPLDEEGRNGDLARTVEWLILRGGRAVADGPR